MIYNVSIMNPAFFKSSQNLGYDLATTPGLLITIDLSRIQAGAIDIAIR